MIKKVLTTVAVVGLVGSITMMAEEENKDKVLDENTNIVVNVKKGSCKVKSEDKDGKKKAKEMFTPEVVIYNPSMFNYPGNKGLLVFLAESQAEKNVWMVLSSDSFTVNLTAGETFRWEGTAFDVSQGGGKNKKGGYEYDGYIFVLTNAEGKDVKIKSSSATWTKNIGKIRGLKKGQTCSKDDFKP